MVDVSAYQPTIREMPQGERPRERMRAYGPGHLNNTELIAILLRTGMKGENVLALSSRLLAQFDGLAGLTKATFSELCRERGLSEAKVSQLLAALELGRRGGCSGAGRQGNHQRAGECGQPGNG